MADDWSPGERSNDVVDVPLIVVGPAVTGRGDEEPRPTDPNWRRAVSVALVGGLLGGIVLSAVLLRDDDESEAGPATTVAPDERTDRITTPPTLSPLVTLPPPDDPSLGGALGGPVAPNAEALPTYPMVAGVDSEMLDLIASQFDLDQAIDRLRADFPRRSRTHVELGAGGYVLDVTIVRDPGNDRYQLTLELRGQTQIVIVDGATDTTYLDVGTENRTEVPNSEIIANSDAGTVNEFFDRLLLGPLRPDTVGEATTQGRGLVEIDEIGLARQFITTIQGSLIPEWQLYAFSPVSEFPFEDRPAELEYSVYVNGAGDLVRLDGVSSVGNVQQLVQHRLEVLDPPVPIDLAIGTAPNTTTPATSVPTSDSTAAPATASETDRSRRRR
ncbi:MAG: hypothetical protein ABIP17_10480 [Ilumatobacteraceae bacterium]